MEQSSASEEIRTRPKFFDRLKPSKISRSHVGKKAEARTFYEYREDETATIPRWIEHAQASLPGAKKVKFEGAAVQLYKVPDQTPNFANVAEYTASYIRLQSPFLRKELQPYLEKHDVIFQDEKADIHWPLSALFFERHHIQRLAQESKDNDTREHLELLCKVINNELGSTIDEAETLGEEGKITYDLLWTLFPAASLIISAAKPYHQGYRIHKTPKYVISSTKIPRYDRFSIDCQYIVFDGLQYGNLTPNFEIRRFSGKKSVKDLEVYPYTVDAAPETLFDRMSRRGERVLQYQDHHYMQSSASDTSKAESPYDEVVKNLWRSDAHGKAVIDTHAYVQTNSFERPKIEVLADYDSDEQGRLFNEWAKSVREADNSKTPSRRLTNEERAKNVDVVSRDASNCFIIHPELKGFSLLSKTWETFTVDSLSPLSSNTSAFDHLVLEPKKKNLLYTLVESHRNFVSLADDVIGGKGVKAMKANGPIIVAIAHSVLLGQGLRVLLSGPPGTGKTLTAEAIAEKVGCPLYSINAQDLGEGPAAISSSFAKIMENAAEWNALVLLDEADVYLKERSESRAEKNEIVTVFLRHLEYYRGILFLTTNLFSMIDQAIESRIHVHIEFSPLPPSARSIIWERFLARLPEESNKLAHKEMEQLGYWSLNGRQIKNALFMTLSWCRQNGKPVTFDGIEDIISMTCPRSSKSSDESKIINGITDGGQSQDNANSHLLDF